MSLVQDEVISDLRERAQAELDYLEQQLRLLSSDTLNQKPDPKSWSLLECLEHLNILGKVYLRGFRQKADSGTPRQGKTYQPGWLGNYAANSMLPKENGKLPYKLKALPFMTASKSTLDKTEVLNEQAGQLREFLTILDKLAQVDLGGNRVATSLGSWLKFKLGDAMRFYLNHQERHYLQLRRTRDRVTA